jgi:gliding motility-associated-like protein
MAWTQLLSQPPYDACADALELCPNNVETVNNIGATVSTCSTCEDYIDTCFTPINSIWIKFTTFQGGNATFSISNVQYQPVNNTNNSLSATVIQADVPCNRNSFDYIDCFADTVGDFSFNLSNLLPNTTYYVLISGTKNGPGAVDPTEAIMDVSVFGPAVDRTGAGVAIGATKTLMCKGESTTIIADITQCPGQKSFEWYLNGSLWFTGDSAQIATDELNLNDQLYLKCNCFDVCTLNAMSNTLTFTVLDFLLDAGLDVTIHEGESTQLNGHTNGVNHYWLPAIFLSDTSVLNPIATPKQTTSYFLTASNGVCNKTDEVTVTVLSQLNVPTVFSPNGDGIDDTWKIDGIENFPDANLEILDRWGQRVFQAVGYSSQKWWNGTSPSGKPLASSTYYYIIHLNNSEGTVQKGVITILR